MAYKRIYHEFTVANTYTTVYTVPAGKKFVVTQWLPARVAISNGSASGTITTGIRINGTDYSGATLDPDSIYGPFKGLVLNAGDYIELISANASDASYYYTLTFSGVEDDT